MSSAYAVRISTSSSGSWTTLPTPTELNVTVQTLDSAKSGRDNNTGAMFRDKITEKLTVKMTLPYGINNTNMASYLSIIKSDSFYVQIIDPRTGTYRAINVYCATIDTPIAKIETDDGVPSSWIYDAISLSFVEM